MDEATPCATQHGVEGEELENVVVIDDSAWHLSKMGNLLAGRDTGASTGPGLLQGQLDRVDERIAT
ncbi:hypothetical protein FDA94_01365 [Herbidospora galbida]|uniref:Uncharacterized protein n=1 Tax=Herbidospora galbida TaxID=2575442 RepID=A0A4U3MPC9_9ACTN|nr:hypothetical protein [Herbidospora galbida]TKK91461.1 hypothetical protein FDA94_01365 [Herbidospora galbida]